ncbi:hypothetical protein D0Z08_19410 [Nocardioides immobilis]|uniref:Uncharacterized protein n=1 Tax=Nocardioides immobilis TaxID=2049295 RepID=A0A417XYE9_9ACTN|nr:SIR2 family protein [Nocardioides immobilis]RHW25398.1 hypothetical protein D0Z08_19410 [Nocardioides immobilis]
MPIATVGEALASLRANHPSLLDDLNRGDRAFWVGSGVSFDQVPGLGELLHRVLEFLRANIDAAATDDMHRDALDRIIEEHLPSELATFRADPCAWPIPTDLSELETSYSEVLGTEVGDRPQDYLLWDAVDVRQTYGSPDINPGPDHQLIAFLIHEGVLTDIVTTNWDGLLEKAVEESAPAGNPPPLAVVMSSESFRTARGRCTLYKAHGCAVLAREDEANRQYLVAQTTDIAKWLNAAIYAPMVERLRTLARTRRSLMLGLSVQDYNLLSQIAGASEDLPWHWDPRDPAYLFAELVIKTSQRNVLQVAYDNYTEHRVPICGNSATGMYSGLLLGASVVHVVTEKMRLGISYAPAFAGSAAVVDGLGAGVTRLETGIVEDASGNLGRLVELIRAGISSMTNRYFDPTSTLGDDEYAPFYGQPLGLGVDDHFKRSGLPELSVALGLLGLGVERHHWTMAVGTGTAVESGVIELTSGHLSRKPSKVVLTRDWTATNALTASDLWTSDPGDILVIQATGDHEIRYARGVSGGIGSGRTAKHDRRQIWLTDLESHAGDIDALMDAFRAEVSV